MTPRWALLTLMCLALAAVLALQERGRNTHWTTQVNTGQAATAAPVEHNPTTAQDDPAVLARMTQRQ